jgi:hypothetical protein|tara:strand:+ start:1691 stop:1885 length:195 start_codon:yes stop_codon:yes gene_type:complete
MKVDIYNEKEGTYFSIQDRKPEPFWDTIAIVIFWIVLVPLILSFLLLGAVIRRLKIIDQRIFKQ